MAQGFGFWWRGVYWASLSTGGSPARGRHDFFFGPVGADTHGHTWIKIDPDGDAAMGTQIKDQGKHVGPRAGDQSFSTQAVLRGRAEWHGDKGTVTTQIGQLNPASTYSVAPVVSARAESNRAPQRIDIALPETARWFDFELAFTKNRHSSNSSDAYALPFSEPSPLAANLRIIKWGEDDAAA